MKSTRSVRLLIGGILCFLLIYSLADAEVTYRGEICIFNNTRALGQPPVMVMKLGVLSYGDGHFVLNGGGGLESPDSFEPISGTGVLGISGKIFVATLVSSVVGTANTSFTVRHLVLNLGGTNDVESTVTAMTVDMSQPMAQTSVSTIPVYMLVCTP